MLSDCVVRVILLLVSVSLGYVCVIRSDREGWIKIWSLDHHSLSENAKPLLQLYSGCQHFCKIDCQRQNG